MKKLLVIMLSLCMAIGLTACGGGTAEEKTYDDDFLSDMVRGLQTRWDLSDEFDEKYKDTEPTNDEFKTARMEMVDAELEILDGYTEKKFEDSKLQELAIQYINQLKAQKEALDYLVVDYDKCLDEWTQAYDERSKLIVEINDAYTLNVDEKYKDTLQELTTNASLVKDKEKIKELVEKMLKTELEKKSDEYGWAEYTLTLENITDATFQYFEVDVKLLDDEGVTIETLMDSTSNWASGDKTRFTFTTDKDFDSYKLESNYYLEEE